MKDLCFVFVCANFFISITGNDVQKVQAQSDMFREAAMRYGLPLWMHALDTLDVMEAQKRGVGDRVKEDAERKQERQEKRQEKRKTRRTKRQSKNL